MNTTNSNSLSPFGKNEESGFKQLFDLHYRPLTVFASEYVKDIDTARDIVQNVFVRLWEVRHALLIKKSVKAYLYQSVKNACINHSKSKYRLTEIHDTAPMHVLEDDVLDRMIAKETLEAMYKAIETLPDRCRDIFKLSRFSQLKHAEISKQLNISEKTVENQISIALRRLAGLLSLLLGHSSFIHFIF